MKEMVRRGEVKQIIWLPQSAEMLMISSVDISPQIHPQNTRLLSWLHQTL